MNTPAGAKSIEEYGAAVPRSKNFPWYYETYGDSLTDECRDLFVNYSKVPEESLSKHIYEVRDFAWKIFPFPCIGEFWFLAFGLSKHPKYEGLVSRLKADSSSRLLDIGTCLGQDLRKLAHDGVPITSLYGTDILGEYEEAGFRLFKDEDRFANRFHVMDFLSEEEGTPLANSKGQWDVLSATMFLHVFDLEDQKKACRNMLALVRGNGSWIMGASSSSATSGEQKLVPPFVAPGEERSVWRHSRESFVEMWEEVAASVGKNVNVWTEYEEYQARFAGDDAKKKFFSGHKQKRMWYFVEVLN